MGVKEDSAGLFPAQEERRKGAHEEGMLSPSYACLLNHLSSSASYSRRGGEKLMPYYLVQMSYTREAVRILEEHPHNRFEELSCPVQPLETAHTGVY